MTAATIMSLESDPPVPDGAPRRRGLAGFFGSRWRGEVPAARVLWPDMLIHGTTINILAAVAGLASFASDAPTLVSVLIYFAPLPYNLFLFAAFWRAAAGSHDSWMRVARVLALVWLAVMLIL